MDKSDQIPEEQPYHSDDFQQIKGIGKSIAQALNELGINDYAELAQFTPQKLSELLKPMVAFISAQRIERDNWLDQARILAGEKKTRINMQSEKSPLTAPGGEDNIDESHQKTIPGRRQESWREVADFFVSFGYAVDSAGDEQMQTKVHHSQADLPHQWDGIAIDELTRWMLSQANLPGPQEIREEGRGETSPSIEASSAKAEEESTSLILSNLWVSQVKAPALVQSQTPQGLVRVEGNLIIAGKDACNLSYERNPFIIEIYLVNLQTKQSEIVANYSGHLSPEVLSYEIQQDFPIPNVGQYQLFAVARSLPPRIITTHLQGPVIRVKG